MGREGPEKSLDGRPAHVTWHYDRAELAADAVVHFVGLVLGAVGTTVLLVWAAGRSGAVEITSILVYSSSLLLALGLSAAYNLWPVTSVKWILRRLDHSAIYLLIAGTYTPFVTQIRDSVTAAWLISGVWTVSVVGVILKLALPGRLDRLSVALYLLLGWSGVLAYEAVVAALPTASLVLLLAGGLLYSIGVIFHGWISLRFHNAVWHTFVLLAASCHYGAVVEALVLGRL